MKNPFEKSKTPNNAEKPKKPEKSQAELRAVLEQKLKSLKPTLQEGIKEYEQALKDDVFEDADGEQEDTGVFRKDALQEKIVALFDRAEKMKARLDSKERLPQAQEKIQVNYSYTNPKTNKVEHQETITLDVEAKLTDFLSFYQKTNINLPLDFEDTVRDIWDRNQTEIEQAIEQNGFDDLLVIPGDIPLADLADKMKMENGYYTSSNFDEGGGFTGAVSQNIDKPRLILVHKTQNLKDRPELKQTLNTKGQDVKLDQALTPEDYLVFQGKYFEETGKHLDEDGWTWLATKSGARLVYSGWSPVLHELHVNAFDLTRQRGDLGIRPSRCFF